MSRWKILVLSTWTSLSMFARRRRGWSGRVVLPRPPLSPVPSHSCTNHRVVANAFCYWLASPAVPGVRCNCRGQFSFRYTWAAVWDNWSADRSAIQWLILSADNLWTNGNIYGWYSDHRRSSLRWLFWNCRLRWISYSSAGRGWPSDDGQLNCVSQNACCVEVRTNGAARLRALRCESQIGESVVSTGSPQSIRLLAAMTYSVPHTCQFRMRAQHRNILASACCVVLCSSVLSHFSAANEERQGIR